VLLAIMPLAAKAQTQPFTTSTPAPTELKFTGDGGYFTTAGGAGLGAYGVSAGSATITSAERTIPINTPAGSLLSFKLANPVGNFNTTSRVQVFLNIDRAGFVQELDITSTISASYVFDQFIANNDASGAVTKTYTGTSSSIIAIATSGGSQNQRPVSRVTISLPASLATEGKRVTVRVVLTAATGAVLLLDDLALTLANGTTPLPVELTRFDATAKCSGVALSWATASEKNSAYFEVQRSATGEAYTTIGKVAAQGNSTSLREYAYADSRPLAGLAYYRLRQVDTDGSSAYSPVATVRTTGPAEAQPYPNPTTDAVMLPASLGALQYRIYNPLGQTLLLGQATGNERLDIRTLPKGPFFLELTDATGRHIQRLVKE
jgi:hypothetical protein